MMKTLRVQFFSSDNYVEFDKVLSISLCGLEGGYTILPNHAPYLIYIIPGIVTVKVGHKNTKIIINTGILEIANNICSIVTNEFQL